MYWIRTMVIHGISVFDSRLPNEADILPPESKATELTFEFIRNP